MINNKFDLQTALVSLINSYIKNNDFTYIKQPLYIQFLDKENQLGLVASPGAHITDVDYSGLAKWVYNYVATIRTARRVDAYNQLNELCEFLQKLNKTKELVSSNKSFKFDSISISSDVHELQEDLKTVTYQLDVAVFVYRKGEF